MMTKENYKRKMEIREMIFKFKSIKVISKIKKQLNLNNKRKLLNNLKNFKKQLEIQKNNKNQKSKISKIRIRILKISRFSLENRKKAKKRRFLKKFKKLLKIFEREGIVIKNTALYLTKNFWTQHTRVLKNLYANLTKELEENFLKKQFFRTKKLFKHKFTLKKYKKPMLYNIPEKYYKKRTEKRLTKYYIKSIKKIMRKIRVQIIKMTRIENNLLNTALEKNKLKKMENEKKRFTRRERIQKALRKHLEKYNTKNANLYALRQYAINLHKNKLRLVKLLQIYTKLKKKKRIKRKKLSSIKLKIKIKIAQKILNNYNSIRYREYIRLKRKKYKITVMFIRRFFSYKSKKQLKKEKKGKKKKKKVKVKKIKKNNKNKENKKDKKIKGKNVKKSKKIKRKKVKYSSYKLFRFKQTRIKAYNSRKERVQLFLDYIQKPQSTVFKKYRRRLRPKKRSFRHAQFVVLKSIYKQNIKFNFKKSKYKLKHFKTKALFLKKLKKARKRLIYIKSFKKKTYKKRKKTNYKLFRNFIKIIGFNKKFLQQLRIQRYYYISTQKKLLKIHKQRQRLKILKYFMKGILKNRKVYRPRIWYFFKRSRCLARRIFRKKKGFIRIRRYIRKRFFRAARKFKRKSRRKLQGLKGIRYRRVILRRKRYRRKLFRHKNRRKYRLKQRGIHGQKVRHVNRYKTHLQYLRKNLPGALKIFKLLKYKLVNSDKKKNKIEIRTSKGKAQRIFIKEIQKELKKLKEKGEVNKVKNKIRLHNCRTKGSILLVRVI